MVINKKASKTYNFFVLQVIIFPLKFVGTVLFEVLFAGTVFVTSIISSHVTTESSVLLAKYLQFLQLNEEGSHV